MDSRQLLLAAKERMGQKLGQKMRSFRVGKTWLTLKKDDTTGTGCNIYFDYDNNQAWFKGLEKDFLICEHGVDMYPIMDAVIVWFLYPEQARKMLE